MNADRIVIRWAAVNALNNFLQAPFPTIAQDRIFDSRIEPMEDFKGDQVFHLAVVYTDYDKDCWDHFSVNNMRDRMLTVTLELLVAQITGRSDDGFVLSTPTTDSELETSLDIFEIQCANALKADNVAANCFRHFARQMGDVISRRGATVEGGQKIAARQITLEFKTPRGPTTGVIAPDVAAFLNRLAQVEDYADRVQLIRDSYLGDAAFTSSEQLLRTMGFTTEEGRILGYERGPAALLGSPVTYETTLNTGSPP